MAVQADVANAADVHRLFKEAEDSFGGIQCGGELRIHHDFYYLFFTLIIYFNAIRTVTRLYRKAVYLGKLFNYCY